MLNYWFNSNDEICADKYFFPVPVDGKCRSEKWELYLYGDKTFKVDRFSVDVLPRGVPCLGSSPNSATDHTIYELCLPFEREVDELESGRSTLDREVQWDFRVHGSSCGS